MNTYTESEEQVPCIKLLNYKVTEAVDHTFTVETVWEDQCHHEYMKLFHDSGDDAQGTWTEEVEGLPSLLHVASEIKIQEALHAKQGGYTAPDEVTFTEPADNESSVRMICLGALVPIIISVFCILI